MLNTLGKVSAGEHIDEKVSAGEHIDEKVSANGHPGQDGHRQPAPVPAVDHTQLLNAVRWLILNLGL